MRINRTDKIAGQPILKIRDIFKDAGSALFSVRAVMDKCGISEDEARAIIEELARQGFIEPDPDGQKEGFYRTTGLGLSLANARAVKPITRDKADKIFADFMKRVEQVNARDELAYYVEQVGLFGSYVDNKATDFADIDIMVDIQQRLLAGRDIIECILGRAEASGKTFGSYLNRLAYAENEVLQFLKARKPHISLHSPAGLRRIGVRPQIVFEAKRKQPGS